VSTKFTNPASGKNSSIQTSTTDGDALASGRITSNDKMLATGNINISSAGIKTVVSSFIGLTILKTDGTTKIHSTNAMTILQSMVIKVTYMRFILIGNRPLKLDQFIGPL
jgi:hypothetical protein